MVKDAEIAILSLLGELRATGRFAPRPKKWADFHRTLTRGIARKDWPAFPLILSAHWSTSAADKHRRLEEHLVWAGDHDRLDQAVSYLLALSDEDWRPMPAEQWTDRCGNL